MIKIMKEDTDKFVIVNKENNELFTRLCKGYGYKSYSPSFTRASLNNYSQTKIFPSKEAAEKFLSDHKEDFKYNKVFILSYDEAMAKIGDTKANQQSIKDKRKADAQEYRKQYAQNNKEKEASYNIKDPGIYRVRFYYSDSWLGSESFEVEADSINDAFNKAKQKALRQDPNRNISGYDHKMTFTKQYIKKIK